MNTQTVEVKLSDKLERDAAGKVVLQVVKDEKGKDKEVPKVAVEGKKYSVAVTMPQLSDFTQEQLQELIAGRIENLVRASVREADKEGDDISELSLSVSDVIGERLTIDDALVEKVQEAFKDYLAKAGKSDKAKKNNAALMVAAVGTLAKTDQRFISAYEGNLQNFATSLEAATIGEFSPVLDRAAKRLEKAKAANIGELI